MDRGAERRIEASAAEVRLAEAGRPVRPVALQELQAVAQDGEAALEPGGRDDRQVVQRRVVLGILAVLGAHHTHDRQVDARAAVLPLVAAAVEERVADEIRMPGLQDVERDPVGERAAVSGRQVGVRPVVADAGHVEARHHVGPERVEVA